MQTLFLSSVECGGEGVQNYANNIFKFFKTGTHFFRPNFLTKSWIGPKSTKKFFFRNCHIRRCQKPRNMIYCISFSESTFLISLHRKKTFLIKQITSNVMHQGCSICFKMKQYLLDKKEYKTPPYASTDAFLIKNKLFGAWH